MLFNAYTLNKTNQYATEEEIAYLAQQTYKEQPKNIVMLGAGPGVLMMAALHLYVIEKAPFPKITVIDNQNTDYVQTHLRAMGVPDDKMEFWLEDSALASKKWDEEEEIDLLIIDADHSEEAVLLDIDAWFPFVSGNGMLFFHDYLERDGGFNGSGEWTQSGVARAIGHRQWIDWTKETEVGISVVYRKL